MTLKHHIPVTHGKAGVRADSQFSAVIFQAHLGSAPKHGMMGNRVVDGRKVSKCLVLSVPFERTRKILSCELQRARKLVHLGTCAENEIVSLLYRGLQRPEYTMALR